MEGFILFKKQNLDETLEPILNQHFSNFCGPHVIPDDKIVVITFSVEKKT